VNLPEKKQDDYVYALEAASGRDLPQPELRLRKGSVQEVSKST
jgi:hypothetical protein